MGQELWQEMASLPWWSFVLTAVLGMAFGSFQAWLWQRALLIQKPKKWLLAVKMLLWAGMMVGLGCLSIPLTLVFTLCATITLLARCFYFYKKAQKEAE